MCSPAFSSACPANSKEGHWKPPNGSRADLLPKVLRRRVASFADLVWDCDPALLPCFDRYLSAARELGFGCKIHADGADPSGAISLAARHRAASIDHLEHATECDVRQLAELGVIATLLPSMTFGAGPEPPARALIDAGAAVALGTNFNPHHSPALSMQSAIALACGRWGMTIEEAISAATINGAYALGCAGKVGSLEPGKSADLVILNAGHLRDLELCLGTNLVHLTMKGGRFIYKEGGVGALPANDLP